MLFIIYTFVSNLLFHYSEHVFLSRMFPALCAVRHQLAKVLVFIP